MPAARPSPSCARRTSSTSSSPRSAPRSPSGRAATCASSASARVRRAAASELVAGVEAFDGWPLHGLSRAPTASRDTARASTTSSALSMAKSHSTTDTETRHALAGYQEAMTYVLQAAQDDLQVVDEGFVMAAAPVFSSIEEYLGRNTPAYYEILDEVGRGSWHPENDALPWIRFCLTAHYRQAITTVRRIEQLEEMWRVVSEIAGQRRLPERCVGP